MTLIDATIQSAKAYVEHKAGFLKQPNGKYKAVQAARMQRKLARHFKRQMEWTATKSEKLSFFNNTQKIQRLERKTARDEIKKMLDDLPENEEIADAVAGGSGGAYKKGAKAAYLQFDMESVGIEFGLINDDAVAYIDKKKTLHLSDFKGSIKTTTKKRILNILTDAAESGQSYQETARKIRAQGDEGVFSRNRAEMIATNEVGHAYGEGNHEMVVRYHRETGALLQKYWITVHDERVTAECAANEAEGWIEFERHFASGDEIAPRASNPRCRCDTGYRRVDAQGNEV